MYENNGSVLIERQHHICSAMGFFTIKSTNLHADKLLLYNWKVPSLIFYKTESLRQKDFTEIHLKLTSSAYLLK
jgi:hypothetical protein